MKRYVKSNTEAIPLSEYYDVVDDQKATELTGYDSTEHPCEEVEGYDVKHIGWGIIKPEYEDRAINNGLDVVELLEEEDGTKFFGYCAGDSIYSVDEYEIVDEDNN